jgi:hypothetical protein
MVDLTVAVIDESGKVLPVKTEDGVATFQYSTGQSYQVRLFNNTGRYVYLKDYSQEIAPHSYTDIDLTSDLSLSSGATYKQSSITLNYDLLNIPTYGLLSVYEMRPDKISGNAIMPSFGLTDLIINTGYAIYEDYVYLNSGGFFTRNNNSISDTFALVFTAILDDVEAESTLLTDFYGVQVKMTPDRRLSIGGVMSAQQIPRSYEFIEIIYNASASRRDVYVNGELFLSAAVTEGSAASLYIGSSSNGVSGIFFDLAVYDRTLTSSEVYYITTQDKFDEEV